MVLAHTSRGDVWRWEKIPGHERNEALDCRNYAMAALKIINPDMDAVERRLRGLEEKKESKASVEKPKRRNKRAEMFSDW